MGCFGCCEDDDPHKAADTGGPFVANNSAGYLVGLNLYSCFNDFILSCLGYHVHLVYCITCIYDDPC